MRAERRRHQDQQARLLFMHFWHIRPWEWSRLSTLTIREYNDMWAYMQRVLDKD